MTLVQVAAISFGVLGVILLIMSSQRNPPTAQRVLAVWVVLAIIIAVGKRLERPLFSVLELPACVAVLVAGLLLTLRDRVGGQSGRLSGPRRGRYAKPN